MSNGDENTPLYYLNWHVACLKFQNYPFSLCITGVQDPWHVYWTAVHV